MVKAVNVVMSDVGTNKVITFNIEVDSVLQVEADTTAKFFSVNVVSESEVGSAVQSVLADYLTSISTPSNPTTLSDITLT